MSKAFELPVSPTMGSLQLSMTLGITAQAKAMIAAGEDVAGMCAGEPDFDTPEHIKDAAIEALRQGDTKYTPESGKQELRKAIAAKLERENGIPGTFEQVIVGCGAKFSVFSAVAALCGPGDEVLIPSPYWLSYPEMVKAAGATPVYVATRVEDNFCVTADELKAALTPRTKLLILNSPSNPTGGMASRRLLEAIAALAVERNFMVLADEIYEKLAYDPGCEHVSIASFNPEIRSRTITVNGFSKSYSMTGWRLGYLSAPLWLAKRIAALQSHTTSNPTSFAQAGALAALLGTQEPVAHMRQAFAQRRDLIHALLQEIPGIQLFRPQGAFYIFPDISKFGLGSIPFCERLLKEARVAAIPGLPFGADRHIRFSYACSAATIEKACARLKEFCAKL